MTDDNSDNLVDIDDLDAFENDFYNREQPVEKAEDAPTEDSDAEEVDENETPLETDEDDAPAETEADEDDNKPEDKPVEKKPRKSAKERIDELTAEKYEVKRELEALRQELKKITAGAQKTEEKPTSTDIRAHLANDSNAPDPDALKEDGSPVYPLGEFDPNFIAALTTYNVEKTLKEREAKAEAERKAAEHQNAQAQLRNAWAEKVTEAEKELPDIREAITDLVDAFDGLEPAYGEYIATTIMQCENGPAIMHYLSQNIGEARKIVASGPHAATLAIGKLEARFEKPTEERRNTKSVSNAPKPPSNQARGSGGRFQTSGDTDNLDAFEREFFQRK